MKSSQLRLGAWLGILSLVGVVVSVPVSILSPPSAPTSIKVLSWLLGALVTLGGLYSFLILKWAFERLAKWNGVSRYMMWIIYLSLLTPFIAIPSYIDNDLAGIVFGVSFAAVAAVLMVIGIFFGLALIRHPDPLWGLGHTLGYLTLIGAALSLSIVGLLPGILLLMVGTVIEIMMLFRAAREVDATASPSG